MLTCHEILAFIPAALGHEILNDLFNSDKPAYRTALTSIAEARKVRPVYLERQPRTQRHGTMLAVLGTSRMEEMAATLLRAWLLKSQLAMVTEFLDHLGIAHKAGVVEELPASVDDARLKSAIEELLAKHPHPKVAVYLHAFYATNDPQWPALATLLRDDARLQPT
jgi:hypothetical protein